MEISSEILNLISQSLQEKFGFATTTQLDRAVADVLARSQERGQKGKNTFSLSRALRGMRAQRGESLNEKTREQDIQYVRALTTGATPGSYLVPTIQADEIIEYLTTGGIARSSGVRIWPMDGIQNMNVPVATAAPSWVWMAQNSVQQATDPNLGQLSFSLKERRALVAIPNQLLATSVPSFDVLLAELIGLGAAEHEDTAFFATSTVSGGPQCLLTASNITVVNVGGSANGGNLAFSDLIAVLAKAAANKAKGPFCWYMSPRTFWQRVVGMIDLQSRPLFIPTLTSGLMAAAGRINVAPSGMLLGYPVYVSPFILEDEAYGSGTNQSHLIFTNPTYCHIAQDSSIEIAISTERFFDASQTAVRGIQHEDMGFAPPAGITVLEGIN